jgi:hypothetical protein
MATVNSPVAIQLTNGQRLPTPDPAVDGVQTLQNDGVNEPRWVAAGSIEALTMLAADPFPLVDGAVWIRRTGTSPTQNVALRGCTGSTAYDIIAINR